MSEITTELVKELRKATGISIMQCQKALVEADGNMEKALAILKKTSSDIALKKQDRETKDGSVLIKTSGKKAMLLALHCETDFVSKNEDFVSLLNGLGNIAIGEGIEVAKNKAKEMIDPIIQKTGEKIELGEIVEISGDILGSYVHDNKIGVIVSLEGGSQELAKDIAMHYSAMKPEYITLEDIRPDDRKMMEEVFSKEVAGSDKPEDIKKKILDGKINTYFKEKTLLEQPFIKNNDETIGALLLKNKAKIKEVKYYFI